MNFIKKNDNGVIYYFCPEMEKAGFKNMFTTRNGGSSFFKKELNFGTSCNDSEENIMTNYKKALGILGSAPEKAIKSKQTHSDIVLNVNSSFGGEGIIKEQRFFEADGLITSDPDLTLLVFYADCVPILIADRATKTACAVHSGWRGTKSDIVGAAVSKMVQQHNSEPQNLMAAIGPAIGICHFEVEKNIYDEFTEMYGAAYTAERNGKYYIDLPNTVKKQLISSGIPEENIASANLCTYCDSTLYSFRREGNNSGRMAAFIKTPKQ